MEGWKESKNMKKIDGWLDGYKKQVDGWMKKNI